MKNQLFLEKRSIESYSIFCPYFKMSMILRWLLLLSTITLCFIIGIRAQCPRISIRKEIRDLSGDELFRLHRAILSLNRRASPSSLSIWDRFARLHLTSAIPAHGYFLSIIYFLLHSLHVDDLNFSLGIAISFCSLNNSCNALIRPSVYPIG